VDFVLHGNEVHGVKHREFQQQVNFRLQRLIRPSEYAATREHAGRTGSEAFAFLNEGGIRD
jgi:hypothetical protein